MLEKRVQEPKLLFTVLLVVSTLALQAQHERCGTMKYWEMRKAKDPEAEMRISDLETRKQERIKNSNGRVDPPQVTIPVVVHVLYYTSTENISTAQIQSQIIALNIVDQLSCIERSEGFSSPQPSSHPNLSIFSVPSIL